MTEQEIHQSLEQARQGDKQAFRRLVDFLMPRLYAIVYAMIPDTDEVYDILQDTFIKAYRGLPGLRKPEAFVGWISRIAVNTARSRLSGNPSARRGSTAGRRESKMSGRRSCCSTA